MFIKNKLLSVFLIILFLTGCGYKPSSLYVKNVFDKEVYVEVLVDKANPENAAFIKDEMNRLVYRHFKGRVTDKLLAKSKIYMRYAGGTFTPSAFDKNGYMTRYRVNITVNFIVHSKQKKFEKSIYTVHEADIEASSLLSSTLRTTAIRTALEKALQEFLAYVSVKGIVRKRKISD